MKRILALVRAQLSGEVLGERTPFGALAMQAVVAVLLCLIVRGEVGTFGYALFALSIPLALTTVPLLGELGPLLRADPAEEWIGAQPVRRRDLRLGRVLTLLAIVGMLALGSLVPAAVLAPGDYAVESRILLVVAGIVQTWTMAAFLLALQWIVEKFGEAFGVALQTLVFLTVLVGLMVGLRTLPFLATLDGSESFLVFVPQAWFGAPLAPAATSMLLACAGAGVAVAAVILCFAPFPPAPRTRATGSVLSALLLPARAAAERHWVRSEERGPFGLVYDALPAERDFVIRTYPLVAAPLLLFALGADPSTQEGEGLFALLLFAPAAFLPFVLMHVPTTQTPDARWVVDTAPLDPTDEDGGAQKAVAIRLLLPLYLGIGGFVAVLASPELALRLWPLAVVTGLITLRILGSGAPARPLSVRATDLASAWNEGLGGTLIAVGMVMTIISAACWRLVPNPWIGWVVLGLLIAGEIAGARRARREPASAQ